MIIQHKMEFRIAMTSYACPLRKIDLFNSAIDLTGYLVEEFIQPNLRFQLYLLIYCILAIHIILSSF